MTEILMIIVTNKFKPQNIPSGRACAIICNSIILQIRVLNSECPQDYEVSSTHPDLVSGLLIFSLVIFSSIKQSQNTLHLKIGDTLI